MRRKHLITCSKEPNIHWHQKGSGQSICLQPTQGFLWLVEADEGWNISETLNDWPRLDRNRQPQGYGKLYDYGGQVRLPAERFIGVSETVI